MTKGQVANKLAESIPSMKAYDRLITYLNDLVGETIIDEDVECAIDIFDSFVDSVKNYLKAIEESLSVDGCDTKGVCRLSIHHVLKYHISPDRECKEGCDSNGTEVR